MSKQGTTQEKRSPEDDNFSAKLCQPHSEQLKSIGSLWAAEVMRWNYVKPKASLERH